MAYRSIPNPFRLACEAMDVHPAEVARVAGVPLSWVKAAYYQGTVPYWDEATVRIVAALRKVNGRRQEDGRPYLTNPSQLSEGRLFPRKYVRGRPAKPLVFKG